MSLAPLARLAPRPWRPLSRWRAAVLHLGVALLAIATCTAARAEEAYGLQPPLITNLPRALQDSGWSAEVVREADQSSQATLWRSLGRLSFGLGMQRRPAGSELRLGGVPERDSSELLLGVALRTGRQSRLTFQSSPAALLGAEPPANERQPGTMVLQSSDPYRSLRRGMLRMELDRDSSVGLRVRKRQLMLQYSKTW